MLDIPHLASTSLAMLPRVEPNSLVERPRADLLGPFLPFCLRCFKTFIAGEESDSSVISR
jgi:hypothetical protein